MALGSSPKRVDAKLEAAKVYWGYVQCRTITTVADSTDSLQDTYLDFNVIDASGSEKKYIFYFDTDPAIAGTTGVQIARTTDDSAATIAAAIKTAAEAAGVEAYFEVSSNVVTAENWYPAAITAETDSGTTGFTLAVVQAGNGGYLGATASGIELTLETSTVDITANQFGEILAAAPMVGNNVSLSMDILEMTAARWEYLVGLAAGDVMTDGTTDVVGFGESKLFEDMQDYAGRLILHPIRLADTVKTSDICIWKCAPVPESINFDGTEPQTMNITFKPFLDPNINTKINLVSYGDWTQPEVLA